MKIEEIRDSIINKICLHLIPSSKTKEKDVELFIDNILQIQQKEIEQLKELLAKHTIQLSETLEENTKLKEHLNKLIN